MIVGIDNGLSGAIVALNGERIAFKRAMPVTGEKRVHDVMEIVRIMEAAAPVEHVFIELPQMRPGQGVKSPFSVGKGFGYVVGIICALRFPYTTVPPQTWQKEMFRGIPKDPDTKAMSYRACQMIWPRESWLASDRCKVAHDGMTDAALIAEFGRRLKHGPGATLDTDF